MNQQSIDIVEVINSAVEFCRDLFTRLKRAISGVCRAIKRSLIYIGCKDEKFKELCNRYSRTKKKRTRLKYGKLMWSRFAQLRVENLMG